MTHILLANNQRAGVICSLTLDHIEKAKTNIIDGVHIMYVASHKTSNRGKGHTNSKGSGAATVGILPHVYRWMTIFQQHIRSKLPSVGQLMNTPSSYFFLTNSGNPMSSSRFGGQLKTRFPEENDVTCSKFRKAIVTLVTALLPEEKEDLATHMKHSQQTQRSSYLLSENASNASHMTKLLYKLNTNQPVEDEDLQKAPTGI